MAPSQWMYETVSDIVDITTLVFYGIVCTFLAAFSPPRASIWLRSAIGGMVGIGAAFCLPWIRTTLGV
ncbi:hypothetical protein [Jannaschia seohaensis]|uniref:Uncharacterized protein n=1 Tax=Jannaschia seohaensis TaxID=475081 RepID=A0A2Y9ACN6_9RHOB|nr:hypothetical protein [Jannaschia seohaensis]PWJ21369.1 hypothetical protein BCF38_102621 [Jannaschia seohaensis]SSA41975.1 hypothetical protein SAMN05421539_102621 [Jannaschia seohaensis]